MAKQTGWRPGAGFGFFLLLALVMVIANWAGCDPNQSTAPTVYSTWVTR